MKKCSTHILNEIEKHSDLIFGDKNVAPRKETIDYISQFARAYYVEATNLQNKGVVLN